MNSKVIDQDGVSISEAPNSRQWVLSARASTLGGIHRIGFSIHRLSSEHVLDLGITG
jgi:hypothetical protein